jgi:hypothetical protein
MVESLSFLRGNIVASVEQVAMIVRLRKSRREVLVLSLVPVLFSGDFDFTSDNQGYSRVKNA